MKQSAPELMKCPQCESMYCGPLVCRFSSIEHSDARRMRKRITRYAAKERDFKIDAMQQTAYAVVASKLGFDCSFTPGEHFVVMHIIPKEAS